MRNRGFTLIELLGVIVILSLIMIIAMPKIINSIKSSNIKVDDLTLQMIYNASKLYVDSYEDNFSATNGNKYCITLKDLTGEGYLKSPINVNDVDITNLKSVQVTYENGFSFELKDNGECQVMLTTICTAVESSKAGNTTIGTEYNCNVSNAKNYNFNVLSINEDGSSVNLLMTENLDLNKDGILDDDDHIQYIESSDLEYVESLNEGEYLYNTKDKILALKVLENETSNWNYLTEKTRLPKQEEIANKVCKNSIEKDYSFNVEHYYKSCETWSIGNYWTQTWENLGVWAMNTEYKTLDSYWIYESSNGELKSPKFGIRPVITVPISKLD